MIDDDPLAVERRRPDASARLKRALSYDEWAQSDLVRAVEEADDPATQWVDHEDAMAELDAIVAKARAVKTTPRR